MKNTLDNTILSNKALDSFWADYNCAQSVLSAYSDVLQVDSATLLNVSCGFGAGMGRLQETCGAVSAAYMIFGLLNNTDKENPLKVKDTYSLVQKFHHKFVEQRGTTSCKELIKCDLNTESGQTYFNSNHLKKNICEGCIKDSISLINQIIEENVVAE